MKVKTYIDYLDQIQKKFPEVNKQDIKRIVRYFWKSIYLSNTYGGDVFLQDNDLWCYIGRLKYDSLEHFNYYKRKLIVKLRVLSKRKHIPWDGYYYFCLNENCYKKYISQKKSRGRPKKYFKFGNVVLYKLRAESELSSSSCPYVFRIPYSMNLGWCIYKKDFISDKVEFVERREPLKFKDILTTNNKYGIL